jgi:hypothetical protein
MQKDSYCIKSEYHRAQGLRFELNYVCAQLVRNEPLKVTYSYWDGQGHRRVVTIRKGDTVAQFLQKVKEQLHPDFRELRHAPSWLLHALHCSAAKGQIPAFTRD